MASASMAVLPSAPVSQISTHGRRARASSLNKFATRSRVSMTASVGSQVAVADDLLFKDYKPTCAFLFPGQDLPIPDFGALKQLVWAQKLKPYQQQPSYLKRLMTCSEKLDKLKDKHREGQANLVEALSVKTRNSARYTAMTNDLTTKRARCEQIKKVISDKKNKVDECTTVISKCLHALGACEEKLRKGQSEKENLDSAIAWYQKALGYE